MLRVTSVGLGIVGLLLALHGAATAGTTSAGCVSGYTQNPQSGAYVFLCGSTVCFPACATQGGPTGSAPTGSLSCVCPGASGGSCHYEMQWLWSPELTEYVPIGCHPLLCLNSCVLSDVPQANGWIYHWCRCQ
jgi:hypothetical protein